MKFPEFEGYIASIDGYITGNKKHTMTVFSTVDSKESLDDFVKGLEVDLEKRNFPMKIDLCHLGAKVRVYNIDHFVPKIGLAPAYILKISEGPHKGFCYTFIKEIKKRN